MSKWEHWCHIILIIPSISKQHFFSVVAFIINSRILKSGHLLLIKLIWQSNWKLPTWNSDSLNHIENSLRHLLSSIKILKLSTNNIFPWKDCSTWRRANDNGLNGFLFKFLFSGKLLDHILDLISKFNLVRISVSSFS